MTAGSVLKRLAEPLTTPQLLLSLLLFWMVGALALLILHTLLPYVLVLGVLALVFLAAFGVPAFIRFMLAVMAAQAERRSLSAPDADMLLPQSQPRLLFPLVTVALFVVAALAILDRSFALGALFVLLVAGVLLPLHLLLLTLTHSPLASVSPHGLARLAMRLWPALLWQLAASTLLLSLIYYAWLSFGAGYALLALMLYALLALANLAGGLAATLDVRAETDIPVPLAPTAEQLDGQERRRRMHILNHAYGLASRGNRDGAFRHVQSYSASQPDALATDLWFFRAMLDWDLDEVPLFFAQGLLGRLLDAGEHARALKLATACLHRNERFRPSDLDRQRLLDVAEAAGRGDLVDALARAAH